MRAMARVPGSIWRRSELLSPARAQNSQHSGRLAGHVAKLDKTSGGGFLFPGFPARNGHGGIMHAGAEIGLAQAEALPKSKDCARPFGNVHFLRHVCHLPCQVFQ